MAGYWSEAPTEETSESRAGVMYYGPGDIGASSIRNLGRRVCHGMVGDQGRTLRANMTDVRGSLLAVCDMSGAGHNVFFAGTATIGPIT